MIHSNASDVTKEPHDGSATAYLDQKETEQVNNDSREADHRRKKKI